MTPLAYVLAAGIGLVLGGLGGGGSILAVPVFVYVLSSDPKAAIAMSLPVVGITSLAGAWGHWRAGRVNVKQALIFGAAAMAGAYGGARLASFIPGTAQLALLGIVMVGAAFSMLRARPAVPAGHDAVGGDSNPAPGAALLPSVATGLGIGVLTGLLGVGGGFLFVPALVLFARLPMKQAVGTSLLVIAMSAGAGLVGYLGEVPIDWTVVARFTAAAVAGIAFGVSIVRHLPHRALQRAFGVFLLLVAGWMLYQNVVRIEPTHRTHAAVSEDLRT